jgi:flavin-dependent dehydrogenase
MLQTSVRRTHDIVIAGAGPSGSLAALILARAGKKVALLDRASFPRAKVCGNCVNPVAWRIWNRLGLTNAYSLLPHEEVEGFSIHSEGRMVHRQSFEKPRSGPRLIARDIFDDWLRREAEAAGAEFFPQTTVTGVDASKGLVMTSVGEFSADLILGADGRNSLVGRHTGLMPPPRRCHRVGWHTSITAPADLDTYLQMHLFEEGYFGYSRDSPTTAVISMVLDSRRTKDPLLLARRCLPWRGEQEWLRMNPITRAPARLGTGRVWLLGDAARVVEPFTGEGIAFALSTALIAGECAIAGLERNDLTTALQAYARSHRQLYRRRAWVNGLLGMILTTPSRPVRLLRRVKRLPKFVSRLSRLIHSE